MVPPCILDYRERTRSTAAAAAVLRRLEIPYKKLYKVHFPSMVISFHSTMASVEQAPLARPFFTHRCSHLFAFMFERNMHDFIMPSQWAFCASILTSKRWSRNQVLQGKFQGSKGGKLPVFPTHPSSKKKQSSNPWMSFLQNRIFIYNIMLEGKCWFRAVLANPECQMLLKLLLCPEEVRPENYSMGWNQICTVQICLFFW